MYFFSAAITSHIDNRMHSHLKLEGETIGSTHADYTDYHQGIVIEITMCSKGQRVWVEGRGDNHRLYGNSAAKQSTFSGFLISQF